MGGGQTEVRKLDDKTSGPQAEKIILDQQSTEDTTPPGTTCLGEILVKKTDNKSQKHENEVKKKTKRNQQRQSILKIEWRIRKVIKIQTKRKNLASGRMD